MPDDYSDVWDGLSWDSDDEFQEWWDRGGKAQSEMKLKQDRAMEKQRIRNGEVGAPALFKRLARRGSRLVDLMRAGAPKFMLLKTMDILERACEDLRLYIESNCE